MLKHNYQTKQNEIIVKTANNANATVIDIFLHGDITNSVYTV